MSLIWKTAPFPLFEFKSPLNVVGVTIGGFPAAVFSFRGHCVECFDCESNQKSRVFGGENAEI
ncbi:MAG: hypothetical protein DME57_05435 [Verrucomicrobia bacterium]|nr:MAG: hypothetical protein DME57_05435 [Verrucomicrobiota bacterium]